MFDPDIVFEVHYKKLLFQAISEAYSDRELIHNHNSLTLGSYAHLLTGDSNHYNILSRRQQLVDYVGMQLQGLFFEMISSNKTAVHIYLKTISALDIDWARIKNMEFCFCFQRPPENALTCSHALCDTCVRNFGAEHKTFDGQYCIPACVFCRQGKLMVGLKPFTAGMRLLSLDGGGVRGKITVLILKMLQDILDDQWMLQDLFDIVYGTSVGKSETRRVLFPVNICKVVSSRSYCSCAKYQYRNARRCLINWLRDSFPIHCIK